MKRNLLVAAVLSAGTLLASTPSNAGPVPILAFPASHETGTFGTSAAGIAVESAAGEEVTFTNLDALAGHNVKSVAQGKVTRPWCTATQTQQGKCALFYSGAPISGLESDTVDFADKLAPGEYEFFCEPHASTMRGILRIT